MIHRNGGLTSHGMRAARQTAVTRGRIRVTVSHEQGSIATLTTVIAQENGNINNFKIINRTVDFFEILVDIEVRNDAHMNAILSSLRAKSLIQTVERYVG